MCHTETLGYALTATCVSSQQVPQLEGDADSRDYFIPTGTFCRTRTRSGFPHHGICSTLPSAGPRKVLDKCLLTDRMHRGMDGRKRNHLQLGSVVQPSRHSGTSEVDGAFHRLSGLGTEADCLPKPWLRGPDGLLLPHTGTEKMLLKTGWQETTPWLSSRKHCHHADDPNAKPGKAGEAGLATCSDSEEKPGEAKGLCVRLCSYQRSRCRL